MIQRESPQALVVEIGLTSFDGFRVANAAIGQVHATFLVSERRLTLMEDVEVPVSYTHLTLPTTPYV